LLVSLWGCNGEVGKNDNSGRPAGTGPGGPSAGSPPGGGGGPAGPGSPGNGPSTGAPSPLPPSSDPTCQGSDPGPSPLRRLTRVEYLNTVRDLFGAPAPSDLDLPEEEQALGFRNSAESRSVSDLLAGRWVSAAEKLAAAAVTRLPALLACDPARDGEATCLDRFLDGFGKRAWRRPLDAAERTNLKQAFTEGKGQGTNVGSFADGLQSVVQVMLLSPQFMYRIERGLPATGNGPQRLTAWETASRLSYLLWGSTPDEQLLAAAEANKLGTPAEVAAQAERMLKDPRAQEMLAGFADQWLQLEDLAALEKDPMIHPRYDTALRGSMRAETQALLTEVIWRGAAGGASGASVDSQLATLLSAPFSYVDVPLAKYYGLPGVSGSGFQEVALPEKQRAGLLTHAGLLALLGVPDDSLTSLVFRGRFVRERLLCQDIPDPPADAADLSPPFTPQTTAREWSDARQKTAGCGACHAKMDPIGLGLENFDGAGLWRDTDRGKPVDARGELIDSDVDGPYNGPIELGHKLAGSRQVHDCLVTQWFRYGTGRREADRDSCNLNRLKQAFSAGKGDIRQLLVAFTQTDTFLYRSKGDQP
jgi:Protein of unknown function (DUF1592)/Protein of unknown function (DUF1588)/Protein of unknown function (DUF1595)/Protein of unknown function (DUF1587)/Protein of unknown function (DUF1585)